MIVNELSKELGIKNKDLIDYLKSKNFKVSSHMQAVTEDMISVAREHFVATQQIDKTQQDIKEEEVKVESKTDSKSKTTKKSPPKKEIKKFSPDDVIPCRSIVPWYVETVGIDKMTTYKWSNYGDVEYVAYKDLQSWRRKPVIKDGMIMIEDPDICDQWKSDLEKIYQKYLNVDYPEEFFELDDTAFESMLKDASDVFKEVIKYTAIDMIRNENYPTLQKITIIDNILGTGIKEFL